eukprot:CAMPEP_0183705898 /NCGR_PEP_ID=MMETSP0737-20130205/2874_1 /TAXON_ID=385413 /ORGANISM="Thalassiosira miniscula, Strain CCMP1093" /LENGTH=497 /DNA_ID=CAMNT_0025933163 /DNA_START=154 /DNA_END=1643 /DNA_ORIENTATION=-
MGKKSRRRDKNAAVLPSAQRSQQRQFAPVAPVAPAASAALENKYVVKRDDFRQLPRWPNDGIEQQRQNNLKGGPDCFGSIETDDPDTIAMTELLGGYPSKSPLCDIEQEGMASPSCFIRSLPFMFQETAAREQSDLPSAKKYLIEAYKRRDSDVRRILKEINCEKIVYKSSRDDSRFPDFRAILVPLFQKNLASDENIELLFGKVSYVRHLLLEVGSHFAHPPPVDSPAGGFLSQYLYDPEVKSTPAPKSCAECGVVSDDGCSKCSSCKTVAYCSAVCQRKHWPIHKPDCLQARGMEVPEKVIAKAQRKKKEKEDEEKSHNEQEREKAAKQFMENFTIYANESHNLGDCWAHDCGGKMLQIHVPTVNADEMIGMIGKLYVQLRKVQMLSLGMLPDGIDPDKYGFPGIELMDPSNNAHIIVLFERLFADGGGVGLHIDGVFVVEKVRKGRAWWKRIPEPKASYASDDNRLYKLVKYLELAKEKAKPVHQTVDLGIHNP